MSARVAFAWTAFILAVAAGVVIMLAVGITADRSDVTTLHGRFLGPHTIHAVQ
jgi:hypothetical protein